MQSRLCAFPPEYSKQKNYLSPASSFLYLPIAVGYDCMYMQFLNCRNERCFVASFVALSTNNFSNVRAQAKAMSMRQNRMRISNRNQSSFTRKFDIEHNRTAIKLNPTQSNIDRQSKFTTFSLFDCVRPTDINRLTEFNCFRLHFGNRKFD